MSYIVKRTTTETKSTFDQITGERTESKHSVTCVHGPFGTACQVLDHITTHDDFLTEEGAIEATDTLERMGLDSQGRWDSMVITHQNNCTRMSDVRTLCRDDAFNQQIEARQVESNVEYIYEIHTLIDPAK